MVRALTISALLALAPAAAINSAPAVAQQAAQANPKQCNDTPQKEGEEVDVRQHARKRRGLGLGSVEALEARWPPSRFPPPRSSATNFAEAPRLQGAAAGRQGDQRGNPRRCRDRSRVEEREPGQCHGRSTVTGEEKLADGGTCMTVTDVVIVDGEETTVPKKMCRARGTSAFARV